MKVLAWLLLSVAAFAGQDESAQPNVLIILTDDQGWADIGTQGAEGFETPHLDRLAREGVRLTSYYAAQPVCSASRAALLTGCYPNRIGINGALGPGARHGLAAAETTVAELAKSSGYATACYGKWHLGHHPQFLPRQHGFDEYFGIPYSNDMWPNHPTSDAYPPLPLIEGETVLETDPDQRRFTGEFSGRAAKFIEEHRDRPWLVYLAHPMPHVPLFRSAGFEGRSAEGIYGDVIEEVDAGVGLLLATLERLGLRENTIVIFTSDNGPWLNYGDHSGHTGPWREGKGTTFEGGVRVPFIASWPQGLEPAVIDEPVMAIDVLPTLAPLMGEARPERRIDGMDVLPVLRGEAPSPQEAYAFYYHANHLEAVRAGRWKLHLPHGYRSLEGREPGNGGMPKPYTYGVKQPLALYDLEADPGETRDVAEAHPEVLARMLEHAERFRADLGDKLTERPGPGRREPGRLPKLK